LIFIKHKSMESVTIFVGHCSDQDTCWAVVARCFLALHSVETHPASYAVGSTGAFSSAVERPAYKVGQLCVEH